MKYEKPEVNDFGSIAEHTYWGDLGGDCWSGQSPNGDSVKVISFWGDS